jgi:hypothetical protein
MLYNLINVIVHTESNSQSCAPGTKTTSDGLIHNPHFLLFAGSLPPETQLVSGFDMKLKVPSHAASCVNEALRELVMLLPRSREANDLVSKEVGADANPRDAMGRKRPETSLLVS